VHSSEESSMFVDQPIAQNKIKRYFTNTLFYATALPLFFAIMLIFLGDEPAASTGATEENPFRFAINVLAGIHVPLTIYLFFDKAIRQRVKSNPVTFILIPVMIMLGAVLIFVGNTQARAMSEAYYLSYFILVVLTWNFWHFGKQNIGVFSYYRLGIGQRMLKAERQMIYMSAFLGAIAAIIQGLDTYVALYSSFNHFMPFYAYFKYVMQGAGYTQFLLTAVSVLYVVYYYRRLGFKSAIMLLVCTSFFLPIYIGVEVNDQLWIKVFAAITLAHGLQYVTFLMFHSFNVKDGPHLKRKIGRVSIPLMTVMLVALGIVLSELYSFHIVTRHIDMSWFATEQYRTSITDGLANGILLTHFWFDAFFWRFNNVTAREWLLSRYSYLFAPK